MNLKTETKYYIQKKYLNIYKNISYYLKTKIP